MLTEQQKKQGSNEWLELRRCKVTASEMPIILGISPYVTEYQLWEYKTGIVECLYENSNMRFGRDKEESIRQQTNAAYNCNFVPDVFVSKKNQIFMASLDGIDYEKQMILEIKVINQEKYKEFLESLELPEYIKVQVQMQLYCSDMKKALVVLHSPSMGECATIPVEYDPVIVDRCVAMGSMFKYKVDNYIPPDKTKNDIPVYSDEYSLLLSQNYLEAKRNLDKAMEICDQKKQELLEHIGHKTAIVGSCQIKAYEQVGRVNYAQVIEKARIDHDLIESCRGKTQTYFKITEKK